MARRMTPAEIVRRGKILEAYRAGEKIDAIAAELGCNPRTVSKAAADAGISRKHGRPVKWPYAPELRREMRRLQNYGVSAAEARATLQRCYP